MNIGTKVRYKLAFCLLTNPLWFSNRGVIVKLVKNREYWIATVIWQTLENPAEIFTFNLEEIKDDEN